MIAALYKTKKLLKESVGKRLVYQETSLFGSEFKPNGEFPVVGPGAYDRKWYATVVMKDGIIEEVK